MNSLDQYIELYLENRNAINRHSAGVLNGRRAEALEELTGKNLPRKGDEGYEHISIEDMFAPNRGVNINRVTIPADTSSAFRCELPNVSTLMGYVVNDSFVPSRGLEERLPEGLIFCSLCEAAKKYPNLLEDYYGGEAVLTDSPTALNTLLAQDGVFVFVPKGMKVTKPLQILNILNAATPLLAVRRVLIVADDESSVQILSCDHSYPGAGECLSSLVTEIYVGKHAVVDYCEMEETSQKTARCARTYLRQEEGSDVTVNGMTLSCGNTRNDYDLNIAGQECRTMLSGMVIGSDHRQADNCSRLRHLAPHSDSRQLFKYVLDDYSTGAFEGNILVTPKAPYTQAYQSNKNILASSNARMYTRPQLEIYNDDVKCSHGATTGQLDNEALFYMRTRGIPEREARVMLMQAFMSDVVDTVRIDGLRERLRHLVEKRFAGTTVACGDCHSSCKKTEYGEQGL